MELPLVSSDGVELAVTDARGEGTPVVFVHGFSNDRVVWEDLAGAFAAPSSRNNGALLGSHAVGAVSWRTHAVTSESAMRAS